MKKSIALLGLLASTSVMADSDIGCGLGSTVLEGQEGKVFKVLGATLNGISGNQTFGITFGTLGCDGEGVVGSSEKVAMFIDGNMDTLSRDIARGEGEALSALSSAWNIEAADEAAFNKLAQENYANIFTSADVTSDEVLNNINGVIATSELAGYTFS